MHGLGRARETPRHGSHSQSAVTSFLGVEKNMRSGDDCFLAQAIWEDKSIGLSLSANPWKPENVYDGKLKRDKIGCLCGFVAYALHLHCSHLT